MVRLDRHRGPAGEGDALDHVRIERALGQELGAPSFLASSSNTSMNKRADGFALGLRVALAFQGRQETLARIHVHERDVEMAAEQRHHLLGLVQPQQSVVDEDAGELVADRLMDQHRRHRAVDATREAADHAALADLGADLGDLAGPEMRHAPVARQSGDAAHEIADELAASGRMRHLGVELHSVELALSRLRWPRTARLSTRRPP